MLEKLPNWIWKTFPFLEAERLAKTEIRDKVHEIINNHHKGCKKTTKPVLHTVVKQKPLNVKITHSRRTFLGRRWVIVPAMTGRHSAEAGGSSLPLGIDRIVERGSWTITGIGWIFFAVCV
jgi:hypothetical protein